MNKKIINVISQNFEWMKKDFIILVFLIIISAILVRNVEMHPLIQALLVFIPFIKSFIFNSSYAMLANSSDQFSWKFLQGLPLTKKELIFSLSLSYLLSFVPFLLSVFCFWPYVNTLFHEHELILSKCLINLMLFFVLFGISNIKRFIEYPRVEYNKKNADKKMIRFFRHSLVSLCLLLFFIIGVAGAQEYFKIKLFELLSDMIMNAYYFIISWWSVPILASLVVANYFRVLKIWNNEKKSYFTNVWNPKKEYFLIVSSIAILAGFYIYADTRVPDRYTGDLQTSVHKKNYQEIEKLVAAKNDINNVNELGMTPMLAAIKKGDIKMIKLLEKMGASFEGKFGEEDDKLKYNAVLLAIDTSNIKVLKYVYPKVKPSDEYYNSIGFFPIHYVVSTCNVKMLDYLLEINPNTNIKNKNGETPLLVASRVGCFSAVVSLKDAGASFKDKDKNGKNAIDLLQLSTNYKNNDDLKYFLEKNMRVN